VDSNKNILLGIAVGTYKSEKALAIGINSRIHDNLKVNIGASLSGGDAGFGAGAGFQW
ncbi:MAG: hypothetical protein RLZZ210_1593, partial [Pseudomonadota bacterium]